MKQEPTTDLITRSDNAAARPRAAGPGARPEEDEQPNEILDFAAVLWRRRMWVIVTTALFVVWAAVQLRDATPIYQSRAQIRYEPTAARIVDFGEIGRSVSLAEEFNTQLQLIRSPELTRMVIDSLADDQTRPGNPPSPDAPVENPAEDEAAKTPLHQMRELYANARRELRDLMVPYDRPEIPWEEVNEQNRINAVRGRVWVSQVPDTKLINISVGHPDPNKAAAIANAYAEQYQRYVVQNRSNFYQVAGKFYAEQLDQARMDLREAELDLMEAGGDSELTLLEQESELAIDRIRTLQERVYQLDDQIALAKASGFEDASEELRAVILSEDPTWSRLNAALDDLRLERVSVIAENQPDHPDVIAIDRRIAALEDQLTEMVSGYETIWQGRISQMEREREALVAERRKAQERVGALQEGMIQYRLVEREVNEKGNIYNTLLARRTEIDVAGDTEANNVSLVERAVPGVVPVQPNVGRTLILHGMFGLFIGCVLAFGLNWFDRSLRDPREASRMTGLPNLGIIPFLGGLFSGGIPGRRRPRARLINEFDSYSNEAESFRLLRTSLQYSTAGKAPQVVMISSSMPAEGKTTTASNLAISFAGLGEKTIIVDADLKVPSLHQMFGANRSPGLSDVLTGQKEIDDVLQPTGVENLWVLPAGPEAPNPVELLESVRMDEVLEELRGRFGHIVVDAPPLYGMSDSYVMATKADGLCLVASIGRTRTDIFKRTVQSLQSINVRVLGIIFNNQVRGRRSRAYGYYKAPGYGYLRNKRGRYARSGTKA